MPALLPLLLKALPYIALAIAAAAGYFGLIRKGAKQEQAKQQAVQEKLARVLDRKIDAAVSKDEAIDAKVEKQIAEIQKTTDDAPTGDSFKF